MSVYVDNFQANYGRMIMCHMIADTLEELHAMAKAIGIHRKHFQSKQARHPHYDICLAKRKQAVNLGAIELSSKELIIKLKSCEHVGATNER